MCHMLACSVIWVLGTWLHKQAKMTHGILNTKQNTWVYAQKHCLGAQVDNSQKTEFAKQKMYEDWCHILDGCCQLDFWKKYQTRH